MTSSFPLDWASSGVWPSLVRRLVWDEEIAGSNPVTPTVDTACTRGEFVAARNARVKQLRADGDSELAARVATLRRPSVATWAVNAAARAKPDVAAELVDAVRALQRAGSIDVRQATKRLDTALDRLVDAAADALTDIGTKPTSGRRAEVRSALRIAALADDPAPLLEARIVDVDAADPEDTLAAALRAGANGVGRQRSTKSSTAGSSKTATDASVAKLRAALDDARSRHEAAREDVRTAERGLRRIERELDTAQRAVHEAHDAAAKAEALVERRQAELDEARGD